MHNLLASINKCELCFNCPKTAACLYTHHFGRLELKLTGSPVSFSQPRRFFEPGSIATKRHVTRVMCVCGGVVRRAGRKGRDNPGQKWKINCTRSSKYLFWELSRHPEIISTNL